MDKIKEKMAKEELAQIFFNNNSVKLDVFGFLRGAMTKEELRPILSLELYNTSDSHFFADEFLDDEGYVSADGWELDELKAHIEDVLLDDDTLSTNIEFVMETYSDDDDEYCQKYYWAVANSKAFKLLGYTPYTIESKSAARS